MTKTPPSPILTGNGPLDALLARAGSVVLGKPTEIRLAVTCLLANGHLLIEDLPGVGKTTLAHTLARLFGLKFSRIQFTSDLLPADITGVSIFDRPTGTFRYLPGPVFSQLVLADEINRATPKTQSALLEAMEEHQISCDGETRRLPEPFFVIATQNPSSQIGTYSLPESQMDRFLMRLSLGYPDREAEMQLLQHGSQRSLSGELPPELSPEALHEHQEAAARVKVSDALRAYVYALVQATRQDERFRHGLSPRAGLALLAAARAWCYLSGGSVALPDHVKAVFPAVSAHRLLSRRHDGHATPADMDALLAAVPVP